MLVLTRRVGETLFIETDDQVIELMVLRTRGSQVQVGISADDSVRIIRSELKEQEADNDS